MCWVGFVKTVPPVNCKMPAMNHEPVEVVGVANPTGTIIMLMAAHEVLAAGKGMFHERSAATENPVVVGTGIERTTVGRI